MKLSEVLVKPIVTEKSNKLTDSSKTYAFRVDRKANKLEVKKAVALRPISWNDFFYPCLMGNSTQLPLSIRNHSHT